MMVEYMILQVCKITDPARDFRKNDNHTIAFLLQHFDFSADPAKAQRLAQLDAPASRPSVRSSCRPETSSSPHADRDAILAGHALGGASQSEWNQFWLDLQDVVCIIYEKVFGTPFYVSGAAMLSDEEGLLKALKHGACFDQLVNDGPPALTHRCADMALRD